MLCTKKFTIVSMFSLIAGCHRSGTPTLQAVPQRARYWRAGRRARQEEERSGEDREAKREGGEYSEREEKGAGPSQSRPGQGGPGDTRNGAY